MKTQTTLDEEGLTPHALEGIVVLDFGQYLAGPFGPMGIAFEGLDANGSPTGVPALVHTIRILVGSASSQAAPRVVLIGLRG